MHDILESKSSQDYMQLGMGPNKTLSLNEDGEGNGDKEKDDSKFL